VATDAALNIGAPMIERSDILQRLDELRRRREQMLANVNALNGAIEDCLQWLGKFDEAEKVETSAAAAPGNVTEMDQQP
jgi:hypothetical protein